MAESSTEYYIDVNGYRVYSNINKNEAIAFFQHNKNQIEYTYGNLSEAVLMKETTKVTTEVELKLNEVKFVLICPAPGSNERNFYVTRSPERCPIIVYSFDDMVRGNLVFHNESFAKRWIDNHRDELEMIYKKEIVDTIKPIPIPETEIIAAKGRIKAEEG